MNFLIDHHQAASNTPVSQKMSRLSRKSQPFTDNYSYDRPAGLFYDIRNL